MTKVGFKFAALAIAVAAISCGTAQAAPLWYDGYVLGDPDGAGPNYVAGDIGGQIGGAGPFFDPALGWEQASAMPLSATSLTRPGQIHPSTGGSAADNECCGRNSRIFANPWGGFTGPDETFYMGFFANFGTLANPNTEPDNAHHRVIEMHNGSNSTDANRVLMLGYSSFAMPPFNGNTGEGGGNMKLGVSGATAVELDYDLVTPGVQPVVLANDVNTHFMVLKFEMSTSGNDVISAYLDPVGTTEPAAPNAQVSVTEFFADRFSAMVNFVFDGTPNLPAFDELRIADNSDGMGFANVANNTTAYQPPPPIVPEPASLSLLGLAAMGLLTFGRKRS